MGSITSQEKKDLKKEKKELKKEKERREKAIKNQPSQPDTQQPVPNTQGQTQPPDVPNFNTPMTNGQQDVVGPLMYTALFDFKARTEGDLGFMKGDRLIVLDQSTGDWWKARLLNNQQGYIPSNFVTSSIADDWYFGNISRKEAEKYLGAPGLQGGTFLIRDSEHKPGHYALSMRIPDTYNSEIDHNPVKHYRIMKPPSGGFYISNRVVFTRGLAELVEYYSAAANGLCHKLTGPCNRSPPNTGEPLHSTADEYEVPKSWVKFENKLGSGHFGDVWLATMKGVRVAVKTLKEGTMPAEKFLLEASTMKKLRHSNLVQLYAVCTKEEPIYIITEFVPNGNLLDFLRGNAKDLIFPYLTQMSAEIAAGMSYLEANSYIHRDLRAQNVLVGENRTQKIADFGLARVIEEDEEQYDAAADTKFPVKWTAPEAAFQRRFSVKSDVWSFGVLLSEIMTKGRTPYPGMTGREVLQQIECGYRMPKLGDCPQEVYDMMMKCWNNEPEHRPTFSYLQHFFEDYGVSTERAYKEPI